jgi:hypothetical protein
LIHEIRFPEIDGQVCRALPFATKGYRADLEDGKGDKGNQVFVKGFKEWTHRDLYDSFKQFGHIISCKVSLGEKHSCKGYGYVQFKE